MRKWEDIVKDKLEEPDGALPESVFDEFHARFDGAESTRTAKRFPLVWAIVPAIAAGLAAVLLLRSPKAPEEKIEPVRQAPMAQKPRLLIFLKPRNHPIALTPPRNHRQET